MAATAKLNASASSPCQTYHSEDNISELHVRVRLRTVQLPGGIQNQSGSMDDTSLLRSDPGAGTGLTEQSRLGEPEEVAVFRWQEQVASPQDPVPEGAAPAGRPGQRLFSRAQTAGAQTQEDEIEEIIDFSVKSACHRCCQFRRRRAAAARTLASGVLAESIEACERMQLLALLDNTRGANEDDDDWFAPERPAFCEVLLCELRAQENGRFLFVQPPFSSVAAGLALENADPGFPYRFELNGQWYEYSVENASHVPSEAERKRAVEAQQGFDTCAPQMRRNLAGSGFDGAAGNAIQFGVFGEIAAFMASPSRESLLPRPWVRSGTQYSKHVADGEDAAASPWEIEALLRRTTPAPFYTALWRPTFYVVYELSLPAGGEWEVVAPAGAGSMPMCTQYASLSGCWTRDERCIFNQPIELHLAQQPKEEFTLDGLLSDPVPPRLVMQVLRVGSWERQSLHGYSFVDIPRQPGEYEIEAQLWAPVGTITQQLNAKLCGAYIPLASSHLVAVADMHRRDTLPRNRSALRAQTAVGVLHVQLRVIRHKPTSAALPAGISGHGVRASRVPRDATGMPLDMPPERLEGLRRRRAARQARREADALAAGGTAVAAAPQLA